MGRGVEPFHLPQSSTFTIMDHHLSLRHASPSSWSYCSHRCLMSGHVSGQPSSAINLPDQPHPRPSNNSSLTHVSPLLRSGHESSTLTLTYPHGCLKSSVELMTCTVASKITASVGVTHAIRGLPSWSHGGMRGEGCVWPQNMCVNTIHFETAQTPDVPRRDMCICV